MREKGVEPDTMKAYVDAFRWGCPPHAGAGFGCVRLSPFLPLTVCANLSRSQSFDQTRADRPVLPQPRQHPPRLALPPRSDPARALIFRHPLHVPWNEPVIASERREFGRACVRHGRRERAVAARRPLLSSALCRQLAVNVLTTILLSSHLLHLDVPRRFAPHLPLKFCNCRPRSRHVRCLERCEPELESS